MDTDLVIRAQRGDKGAYTVVATEIATRFLAVARRILRDLDLAEDATQQALLAIWLDLPKLRDPARFDAWSYRLLVRACYAEGRRERHRAPELWLLPFDMSAPDVGLSSVIDRDQLERGFHRLSLDHRTVVVLHHFLSYDRGWLRYRDVYVSKDTVGSQGAEAAIYWTGFPDGTSTDPCAYLLGLSADASADDLAAAVSTAPGTELVTGPTDVVVGGHTAKHVVLTVRDNLGCDPGFFFTWEPASGGPGWWDTNVGDTVRVWIIDLDGKLFVLVGESTSAASAKLEQEIQDIVDSIQFE